MSDEKLEELIWLFLATSSEVEEYVEGSGAWPEYEELLAYLR
jgi:hypothetical protein